MGAIHGIRVKSPYQLLKIEDIKIENKSNEHGYLYLKCLIDDSINFNSTIKASTYDKISVYEELEYENNNGTSSDENAVNINEVNERNSKRLFDGTIDNIKTTNVNGVYYLEIETLTSSVELDIKEKSRSFQNSNMTYDELIQIILEDYPNRIYTQCVGQGQKIGKPLFQFKETDWNFIKRIVSELNSELYSDVINSDDLFYFGRPSNASYEIEDMKYYKTHKSLQRFREAGGDNAGYDDTDYFYYEIEKREQYNVGDEIYFKNKQLYVNQYSAYALKEEVIYKYRLCRKNGVWQTKINNSLLAGASLDGKVIAREGEKVKLHLSIDENQNKDEATWFPFAPPTGNIMYCMPIIGTSARLYFPNESSEEPIVTGCLRNNGSSCKKSSDTTKRYLGTEHGSEIEMIPDAINIKGGSKDPLSIKFEDNVGVTLTSHKKLSLNAYEDIIIRTPKNVKINAQSQIVVAKTASQSGFTIENEFNFLGENVMANGRDSEAFAPFDDEPKEGEKPEPPEPPEEEKKPFNWLGVGLAVVGAVVLVAVAVVVAAAASIPAAAVLACAAVGAFVCGVTDVIIQSAQNDWDLSKVAWDQTIIAACCGAGSAALAATPIGVMGQVGINGGIGAFQSALNGGSYNDILMGFEAGMFAGGMGGAGYIPFFLKRYGVSTSYYTKEAIEAISGGLKWGTITSGATSAMNYIAKKAKECFGGESQDNSDAVPAT